MCAGSHAAITIAEDASHLTERRERIDLLRVVSAGMSAAHDDIAVGFTAAMGRATGAGAPRGA